MVKHIVATGFMGFIVRKVLKANAFTSLWNTIYYASAVDFSSYRLRKHEMKHIEQMNREGKIVFSIKYLWQNLTVGYKNNKYEIEAMEAENE